MIGGFGQVHLPSKKFENVLEELKLICWRTTFYPMTLYPISPYLKRVLLSIKI